MSQIVQRVIRYMVIISLTTLIVEKKNEEDLNYFSLGLYIFVIGYMIYLNYNDSKNKKQSL